MNYITYRNKLQRLMDSYISVLPIVKSDFSDFGAEYSNKSQSKILQEIHFLNFKIMKIDGMTMRESVKEIVFTNSILKSSLNEV